MFHDSRDEFYSMEGDSLVFFRVFSKRSIFFFFIVVWWGWTFWRDLSNRWELFQIVLGVKVEAFFRIFAWVRLLRSWYKKCGPVAQGMREALLVEYCENLNLAEVFPLSVGSGGDCWHQLKLAILQEKNVCDNSLPSISFWNTARIQSSG